MNGPSPVRPVTALVLALAAGLLAWVGLGWWVDQGHPFPHPAWFELGALLLIGGTALVLGRRVRRVAHGLDGARVGPLTAARTFALAQASVVTGALLAGVHTAAALQLTQVAAQSGGWTGVVRSAVLAVTAAALSVAGLVVQQWCKRPPSEDDPQR